MSTMVSMAKRLARLEARAEIEELMQRYAAAADRKYTALRAKRPLADIRAAAAEQAACFTDDALWAGGPFGGDIAGRAALAAFFENSPWLYTAHHYGSPAIRLDDTGRANVRWRLLELGVRDRDGRVVLMAGVADQECRATAEGWRIARMRFESLHAVGLADAPEAVRCLIPEGEDLLSRHDIQR